MGNKSAAMPGQVVQVVEGVYRGRGGRVAGDADRTDSVRVLLDHRSAYDKARPKDYAWIPVCFLRVKS